MVFRVAWHDVTIDNIIQCNNNKKRALKNAILQVYTLSAVAYYHLLCGEKETTYELLYSCAYCCVTEFPENLNALIGKLTKENCHELLQSRVSNDVKRM